MLSFVFLFDEMPSFVSREVALLDEMPSFVSREVNLLDEMPSFVSRELVGAGWSWLKLVEAG